MKKYIYYFLLAGAAMFAAYGCSDEDKEYKPETINNPVTGISLANVTSNGIVLTDVGEKLTVEIQKTPADGGDADRFSFDYSSSNPKVFTVDGNGVITARGAGKAILTVTAKNNTSIKTVSDVVVVGKRIANLKFNDPTYSITYLSTKVVPLDLLANVTIEPKDASIKTLRYSSSDPNVATVDEAGIVTAVWEGRTIITAEAIDGSGKKATCEVNVSLVPITSILFNSFTFNLQNNAITNGATSGTLHVNTIRNLLSYEECSPNIPINKSGSTTRNMLRYMPSTPSLTTFKYVSSDPAIVDAVSDENNRLIVKPQSKPGTAVITIEATDGYGAKANLTVVNHAVYNRSKWKIVDSAPNGTNHLGEGGPIENVISDNDVTAGLMKSDLYKNDQSVSVPESFFVVDLGAETKFDYMLTEAIWSSNNNASRPRQISLYGSNSFPADRWTPIQENININHGSYYIVPTQLSQVYSYRYVKAVIWSTTAGKSNATNKSYAYYLIKNFWLGSSE